MKNLFLLLFVAFSFSFAKAQTSNIQDKGFSGKDINVSGYIIDEPKFHQGYDGKYQSYSFTVAPNQNKKHGDEWILVRFHTVKWGKTVGTFNSRKGDYVNLNGKFHESRRGNSKVNLAGSLEVNDKSLREVAGK